MPPELEGWEGGKRQDLQELQIDQIEVAALVRERLNVEGERARLTEQIFELQVKGQQASLGIIVLGRVLRYPSPVR